MWVHVIVKLGNTIHILYVSVHKDDGIVNFITVYSLLNKFTTENESKIKSVLTQWIRFVPEHGPNGKYPPFISAC